MHQRVRRLCVHANGRPYLVELAVTGRMIFLELPMILSHFVLQDLQNPFFTVHCTMWSSERRLIQLFASNVRLQLDGHLQYCSRPHAILFLFFKQEASTSKVFGADRIAPS